MKALRLTLWDEQNRQMIRFRDLRRSISAGQR